MNEEYNLCLKCGGRIVSKGGIGFDRNGQEMECDWDQCENCGEVV